MAFLLLLHQKMKLQRKENMLTLKQLRFSSQVDRMQKKVDKRQKYYDKLKKQLERQANCYKNSMNMYISNQFGLGANSINLANPYASNGAAMGLLQNMTSDQIGEILGKASNGACKLDLTNETILNLIKSGVTKDKDGNILNSWTGDKVDLPAGVDPIAINQAATTLQQMANMQVTNMQTQAQQYKAAYENNVSIWLEAQQEELEAQEEWEMDLLAEEQADMEAEKNSVEVQLQRVQEEKKSIEQALGQAIQDSAPKFGLA